MTAMVDMNAKAAITLSSGLVASVSELFFSVMDRLKQVVTAAQQRVFAGANIDFLNASKAYEA